MCNYVLNNSIMVHLTLLTKHSLEWPLGRNKQALHREHFCSSPLKPSICFKCTGGYLGTAVNWKIERVYFKLRFSENNKN